MNKSKEIEFINGEQIDDGFLILIRYYNSKYPYSKLNYWHEYVGRFETICNDRKTLLRYIDRVAEMPRHMFRLKKEAEAYLKTVKDKIEKNDPISFNTSKCWWPDRFFYKIVHVDLKMVAKFSVGRRKK